MNIRKKAAPLLLLAAVFASLVGCATGGGREMDAGDRVLAVTALYPLAFLAEEIGGRRAQVVNLVPAGVEPHDWSPGSRDMVTISRAHLFIYNGAGFEAWVGDVLDAVAGDDGPLPVKASEGIPLILASGEETAHGEEDGHGHDGDRPDVDPHVWVSPKSARIMADNILAAFLAVDPEGRAHYEARHAALTERLRELDERYARELAALPRKDIVVSHAAFGYLCRDYGLNQVAVMGLAPDAEPRAQDLLAVKRLVEERGVKAVFFEELVSDRLAQVLARETGAEALPLNPLEGLTPQQQKDGENYLTLMERNLENLKKALG
ncbi:MAG: ABC transporter substrate-binding protein [Paenibacillaceae bacterium ZCTH02-B3]|nr:MAG: ABC transporter substrate-binding protein [Paenibacillaceae bacterium ZCTH02-B3]